MLLRSVSARCVALALVVFGLPVLAVSLAPAAEAVTSINGPLLYDGWIKGELRTAAGQTTELPFAVGRVAAFSPDGAQIASVQTNCAGQACNTTQSVISIYSNDGSVQTLPAVEGAITHLAWSPEQTELVVQDSSTSTIYRVPLDGNPVSTIVATTPTFRVEDEGVSWSRSTGQIAFVGSITDPDGSSLSIEYQQLYTVPAEGGSPVLYSKQLPDCQFPSCRTIQYSDPAWSPDGTKLAVNVWDELDDFEAGTDVTRYYVGTVTAGAYPTVVKQFSDSDDDVFRIWSNRPIWSEDGSRLLAEQSDYSTNPTTETAQIIPVGGGATTTVQKARYVDWQPCPTGVCALWGAEPDDCTIKGTAGNDRLVGTAGRDVICGEGGDDVLIGNGGNDLLRGGPGEDQLIGGPGADALEGGPGTDVLRGDEGNDVLSGGTGLDVVTYFNSKKPVSVNLGKQVAQGAATGKDRLIGVEGVFGTTKADELVGSSASNHLFGGPGNDVLRGGGGIDLLSGGGGADRLFGGGGADLLQGDGGADRLDGDGARDVCYDTKATTRKSCELTEKDDPKKGGKAPTGGPDSGTVDRVVASTPSGAIRAKRGGGLMYYWYVGNNDYLVMYNAAATQQIGAWASTPSWEGQVCRFLRYSPAKGACTAANALNTVSKYQMKWFLWNAKNNGGCAVGIMDWGRHGVNQFKKRWKVRSADYDRYHVAIPYVTGLVDVRANSSVIRVKCT